MRRILGFIMLVSGLAGVVLSLVAAIVGWRLVGDLAQSVEGNLRLTANSLETVQETLVLTKEIVGQVNEGMATVEETADDVALAMDTFQPFIEQAAVVTTEGVPESIDNLQTTVPSLIQVASTIDQALGTLNNLRLLDYEPEVPFGESVAILGTSLEGIPEDLRNLGTSLEGTDESLQLLSRDLRAIADVMHEINADTAELEPLIDDYIATVTEINDSTRLAQSQLRSQVGLVRIIIMVILLWLGLTQIAPIYLGWGLLTGGRLSDQD